MPSIRLHVTNLDDLDGLEPEEIDELTALTTRAYEPDLATNLDARARSAELQARKHQDRRKSAVRGARRSSPRSAR